MGRASFGGSQDLSQLFAALWGQYEDRLESLAERAADRATSEQTAKDNDTIDKWQQGELTDEEFLAYVAERLVAEADDPERLTYWKRIQRDAEKSILQEEISDTAEDIIDDINAGKRTYGDLLNFYKAQQKKLRPSDPLYKELADQIEQVDDRILQNQVEGALSGVDYRFRSGAINGRAAGSQLRALAERYRVNDPQRYYQLLSQALEYEQYGGFFSAGGSGGSGSGGGSSTSLNGTIDALQGIEDRLMSLSEQFEAGETLGSITFEDASGGLTTQEVLLRDPDSTASRQMRGVDDEMLNVLDELEAAYIEKGDRSAAGEVANRRQQYITDKIQPRNTIPLEVQANRLLANGQSLIEAAAEATDPTVAWRKVQQWADSVTAWHRRVNQTSRLEQTREVDEATQRDNPELGFANRREVLTPSDARNRTTAEFQAQADALVSFARGVAAAKDVSGLEGLIAPLAALVGDAAAESIIQRTGAALDLVVGIPQGNYARVYIPGEGLLWAPMADSYDTVMGPNGPEMRPTRVPVLPNGDPVFDAANGQRLELVQVEIDGRIQPVFTVSEDAYFIGNQRVTAQEFQSFSNKLAETTSKKDLEALTALGEPRSYRETIVQGADGKTPVAWYQDQAGLWHKRRVTRGGGVPILFSGKNARAFQQWASTTINPTTGQAYDPTGRAYFNERDYQQKRSTNVLEGVGDDWYDRTMRGRREEQKLFDRQRVAQSALEGTGDQMYGRASAIIKKQATQLGINLGAPTSRAVAPARRTMPRLAEGTLDRSLDRASVARPKITTPNIRRSVLEGVDGPRTDFAALRSRLQGIRSRIRRPNLRRSSSSGREPYAGSDFSGFQR